MIKVGRERERGREKRRSWKRSSERSGEKCDAPKQHALLVAIEIISYFLIWGLGLLVLLNRTPESWSTVT